MLLTLTLIADEYQALVIPEASVLQKGTRSLVYVANAQMQVFERDIQIDRRLQGTVVISGGLEIGEKIVVDGIMGVRNGAQVRLPTPEGAATPAWGGCFYVVVRYLSKTAGICDRDKHVAGGFWCVVISKFAGA